MYRATVISVFAAAFGLASAQQTAWGQCGGNNWSGATTCVSGYTCTYSNPYYSQCIPGSASAGSSSTTLTTKTSSTGSSSTTTGTGTGTATTTSKTGSSTGYPGTTLQSGYYWIRAVEDPNFHKYLQTSPEYAAGTAILADYTSAGQFQIVGGQLVELVSGGLLYANVDPPANSSVTMLAMSFKTTQNTFGSFAFSGDAVQWSVASISRPNLSAWLVCANQQLFINLGAYDYLTPAGCADETIHYYNGATAVD